MRLSVCFVGAQLLSLASAWSVYLHKYGCNEAPTEGRLITDQANNDRECLRLPEDLVDYPSFNFVRPMGRCRFSFSTSADNCHDKAYTNTYDANYERGCFRVKQEWQFLTVVGCNHNEIPNN
ncbi:hypothetical protein IF1G_07761 [Cordyceps javanica]|uniref:Secreted protein n=1 Tax=Cordyceps javanica TaxID=43265 RepID=A0A545VUQ0_9HYPO|nr:hypothetical protein IF1G_07761 [Cordyceps javanica]TQW05453.1 hypothetical protein IF2G_07390 [Cordyceps javanica]